ncbi:MAG: LysM peptidoglycan-binding domain-containing protein [Bacilli bacterium]
MNNTKVIIDAGHGGDDPGATGNGIIEKDLTLAISKYMYNLFERANIPVTMTRNNDKTLDPTERTKLILDTYGNKKDVIIISNHINAGGGDGAEVIYALRNSSTLANIILAELSKEGQNIRKAYQRRLPSDTSKDYYFIHRDTGATQPLIIEYGFLDSTGDDVEQLKNEYEKYASAVVKAVIEYIGKETNNPNTYTVKAGDSLWNIAKRYNVSIEELKKINEISNNLLRIGQILKIPVQSIEEKPIEYIIYTIKPGDNLYAIAKKYNLTPEQIIEYNNLKSNLLNIGNQLKLPIKKESAPIGYIIYTIKTNDNLYNIAKKYNSTPTDIMNYNNLKNTLLTIGQQIKIPTNKQLTYIVKSGDNLYSIANKYNTTIDTIKTKNNLSTNTLSIGQTLKI